MGYYLRGDYYRGDYYRGDPFLGAIVKAVAGKSIKKAGGWLKGRLFGAAKAGASRMVNLAKRAAGSGVVMDAAAHTVTGTLGYKMGQQGRIPLPQDRELTLEDLQDVQWTDKHGYFGGRRRRMNPLNPKALNRALRRAQGFEKFARKTVNALYKTVDGRRVKTFKKRGR